MTELATLSNSSLITWQKHFEHQLKLQLTAYDKIPQRLYQAIQYTLFCKAKRIRPLLVYATGTCFGANIAALDRAAIAVECIHTYSLVHDDLPAMDNDDLRRGQSTCHKAFDEATAILVGDALQNRAFEILSKPDPQLIPSQQLELLHLLAHASGASGMVGGQMLDILYQQQSPTLDAIENMHALKTGALLRASILMGAIVAKCTSDQMHILQEFADIIGLAFQIKDDILDHEGQTAVLGKTAGSDQTQQKATALTVLTLAEAKQKNLRLLQQAYACLDHFSQNTEPLRIMAEYIIHRTY